ncbi:RHS repeat-associated core domain-containing protein, partial [Streptomyces sp. NRRL F-2664]|uniref:RHS repeat-associated core domain-containing protein n=1 Tax=Streptomyces sp. NRRL F-2664 TaxID=1463842 RepID=UPI00131E1D62
ENGTDYTPARLYHPETGRFTTRDPHPTPLNKYQAYAANPVEHTDPSGNLQLRLRKRIREGSADAERGPFIERGVHTTTHRLGENSKASTGQRTAEANHVRAMQVLHSSIAPMSGEDIMRTQLTLDGLISPSPTKALFRTMEAATPHDGCQALLAACLKTFGEGMFMKPSKEVTFHINDTAWPRRVTNGNMGEVVEYLRSGRALRGRLYVLSMAIRMPKGEIDGHALVVHIGSSGGGIPMLKQMENGAYGKFDPAYWEQPERGYTAFRYWLFDTGVNKISSRELRKKLSASSHAAWN